MKKQKLGLKDLKVSSFVTNLKGKEQTVAGGVLSIVACITGGSCGEGHTKHNTCNPDVGPGGNSNAFSCEQGCTMQGTCNPGGDCSLDFGELV